GDADMGLALCRAHWSFWVMRDYFSEGRAWLSRLAELLEIQQLPEMRAVAQTFLGGLAWRQGEYLAAEELYTQALPLLRQAGETWVLASAMTGLGWSVVRRQGDWGTAYAYMEEALLAWRATGDQVNVAICLSNMGQLAWMHERYEVARARCEESIAL